MLTIAKHHRQYAKDTIAFARRVGLYVPEERYAHQGLRWNLEYLRTYADHEKQGLTRCDLFPDRPYGFGFAMYKRIDGEWKYWFNGGLLYHGAIDGYGSGAAPVFAVTLTPTNGWAIHT